MTAGLEVSSVALHYGAAAALRGVSVSANAGEVTCVMGRNGVGKTSLLRAIMGTHLITEGEIRWQLRRDGGLVACDRFGTREGLLTGYLMQAANPQKTNCLLIEDATGHDKTV